MFYHEHNLLLLLLLRINYYKCIDSIPFLDFHWPLFPLELTRRSSIDNFIFFLSPRFIYTYMYVLYYIVAISE